MTLLTTLLGLGAGTGAVLGAVADRAARTRGEATVASVPRGVVPGATALVTAVLWTGLGATHGDAGVTVNVVQALGAASLAVGASAGDVRGRIVPNEIVALGCVAGVALVPWTPSWTAHVATAIGCGAGGLLLRRLCRGVWGRDGIGLGDVKLLAVLGLWMGPSALWAAYLAVVAAAAVGTLGLATGRLTRTTRLPFAPFVLFGCVLHWVGVDLGDVIAVLSV